MQVEYALEQLETLVRELDEQDLRERLTTYSIILAILSQLKKKVQDVHWSEYEAIERELLWSCEALCGLDDGNEQEDERHVMWAMASIIKLKDSPCFNA